jgi:beta-lactamase class A
MQRLITIDKLESMDLQYAFYYKKQNQQAIFQSNCSRFSSASIIKIPLLLAWLQLERAGQVHRTEECALDDEPQVRGAGLSYLMATRRLLYQDVLLMMLALSDNLCTNLIIRRIGMERIQSLFTDVLQLPGTQLQRKLMDFEARARGMDNWITAEDCIRLFDLVDELSFEERKWVDSMLRVCQDELLLLRDLPRDSISFRHKTGSIPGILHDWGYTNDLKIFLLTQGVNDEPATYQIFGELGRTLLVDNKKE